MYISVMAKISTYSDLKNRKKPVSKKVYIALDSDKADAFNELASKFQEAQEEFDRNPSDKKTKQEFEKIKSEYDAALAESEEFVVEFVVRSIGRDRFEEILNDNPPTEQQKNKAKKDGEEEPSWNPETFMPALMAASIVSPAITEEEMQEMWTSEDWNAAELFIIFAAALQVNQTRKVVNLGKESGPMLDFGLS